MNKKYKEDIKMFFKGFVIFGVPPLIVRMISWIRFSFSLSFFSLMIKDMLIFGIGGGILTLIYKHVIIKKFIKFHSIIAKIVIGLYYLVFLIYIGILLYFIFVIGDI